MTGGWVARAKWHHFRSPYISAREQGRTPEEAANAANLYMKEVRHVVPR